MRENLQTLITLYRCKAVEERTGLPRSAIYQLMADEDFPKPIKITAKAVAWPSNEIDQWILNRIEAGRQSTQEQNSVESPIGDKLKSTNGVRKQRCPKPTLDNHAKK